jgi:LemA protein
MVLWIVLGVVALAVMWFIGIYNGLVRARNETKNAWSGIDVQLKRRHDLIPNLVDTAKGYMKHEAETLERVIQARNQAISAQGKGPAAAGAAEGALGAALGGFFGLVESYPDLKANENFLALQSELTETENRISLARGIYNDVATQYNNRREVFPANLVAGGFERAELFEIDVAAEREVPRVSF